MRKHLTVLAGLALISMTTLAGCGQTQQNVVVAPNMPVNHVTTNTTQSNSSPTNTTGSTQGVTPANVNPGGVMIPATVSFSKLGVNSLDGVAFINDKVGFVTGRDGIYKTTDGGTTWAKVYTSRVPILGIEAKYQPEGKEEYVVAYTKTYLLRSSDGRHFTMQSVDGNKDGGSGTNIEGVSLLDNNMIYLLNNGVVWASDGMSGALHRATPTDTVSSIAATWDKSGMAVCYAVAGTSVFKTTDTVGHWTKVFSAPIKTGEQPWKAEIQAQGNHVSVLFYGGAAGMSKEAYILFDSNDAGTTWNAIVDQAYFSPLYSVTKMLNQTDIGEYPGPFALDANGDILITGFSMDGEITIFTKISPGGKTIAHDPVGPSANSPNVFDMLPLGVATPDGTHIFAVGSKNGKGVIEASSNGGFTFEAK